MPKRLRRAGTLALISVLYTMTACNGASRASEESSSTSIVARVGDQSITLQEVDERAISSNMSAYQKLHEVRSAAVEALIADKLLSQEARRRGISKEELVEEEITEKIAAVTDADVRTFYDQNRGRLGGQSFEQIGEQIRRYLENEAKQQAHQSFVGTLKENAEIDITLEPPRAPVSVASNEPAKGPSDAPVTLVEYSDFQ